MNLKLKTQNNKLLYFVVFFIFSATALLIWTFSDHQILAQVRKTDMNVDVQLIKTATKIITNFENLKDLNQIQVLHAQFENILAESTFDEDVKEKISEIADSVQEKMNSENPDLKEIRAIYLQLFSLVLDEAQKENIEAMEIFDQKSVEGIFLVSGIMFCLAVLIWLLSSEQNHRMLLEKENSLATRFRAIGQTAAGTAHEINNPLTIIIASCINLQNRINQAPSQMVDKGILLPSVDKIERASQRISQIIKGLHELSKSSEQSTIQKNNLSALIKESVHYCEEKIQKTKTEIRIEGDVNLLLDCRATQISQILINLINNSCDAIVDQPERWVKIELGDMAGAGIRLSVSDSGKGIPKEIAEKLSKPFFTTKGKAGTGLGLSLCRAIADEHQGRFFLDPNSANTKFVLELPYQRKFEVLQQPAS